MMQVHILLTNGGVIQFSVDEKFSIAEWVAVLRRDGYISRPEFYVTKESVAAMVIVGATNEIKLAQIPIVEGSKPD